MELAAFLPALAGGALIGLSAALLVLATGRVAGISGITGSLLGPPDDDTGWRLAFLTGLLLAPLAVVALTGRIPPVTIAAPTGLLALAGFLVGLGTRIGSGCTSGHGVCGIARLSPRSLVATGLFMASAAATVYVIRHVIGA
ncbi:YeeE/YedE family protein [Azospirillum soli]|uniref:YeeE/YedE family protein n=1 Tax=Azospirillum soli TaxID=1304799 RepID=UPI001AEB82D1|nr:YeeE/YedE family protein [Azospirillum soli]MBP2313202.1 putative membrane protein YedE/YeeE [Azospirillum soli]